jgi:hypothetical protein
MRAASAAKLPADLRAALRNDPRASKTLAGLNRANCSRWRSAPTT